MKLYDLRIKEINEIQKGLFSNWYSMQLCNVCMTKKPTKAFTSKILVPQRRWSHIAKILTYISTQWSQGQQLHQGI